MQTHESFYTFENPYSFWSCGLQENLKPNHKRVTTEKTMYPGIARLVLPFGQFFVWSRFPSWSFVWFPEPNVFLWAVFKQLRPNFRSGWCMAPSPQQSRLLIWTPWPKFWRCTALNLFLSSQFPNLKSSLLIKKTTKLTLKLPPVQKSPSTIT